MAAARSFSPSEEFPYVEKESTLGCFEFGAASLLFPLLDGRRDLHEATMRLVRSTIESHVEFPFPLPHS